MREACAGHSLEDDIRDTSRSLRGLQHRELVKVWDKLGGIIRAGSLFPRQDCAAFVVAGNNNACGTTSYAIKVVFHVKLATE
jgi:hypothetical protein